ncbi:MAG: flagellar basal body L-ring protein FlgH [Bdellovibrionota bacterium]
MNKYQILLILVLASIQPGCATVGQKWKELITGQPTPSAAEQKAAARAKETTFSDQNQLPPAQDRQYRRVTRKNFDDGAHLQAKSGSLWVMEGQGAYLFAENTVRMIGDAVSIKIEGEPKEQLTAKADVIGGLIKQLEDRRRRALNLAQADKTKKDGAPDAAAQKAGQDSPAAALPNGDAAAGADRGPAGSQSANFNVKVVPARVVERLVDGNYRVRGTQSFMIGGREYKTIVSGIVRAEDFNEQGVNSTQLLDSSFDIVSAKGAELRQ